MSEKEKPKKEDQSSSSPDAIFDARTIADISVLLGNMSSMRIRPAKENPLEGQTIVLNADNIPANGNEIAMAVRAAVGGIKLAPENITSFGVAIAVQEQDLAQVDKERRDPTATKDGLKAAMSKEKAHYAGLLEEMSAQKAPFTESQIRNLADTEIDYVRKIDAMKNSGLYNDKEEKKELLRDTQLAVRSAMEMEIGHSEIDKLYSGKSLENVGASKPIDEIASTPFNKKEPTITIKGSSETLIAEVQKDGTNSHRRLLTLQPVDVGNTVSPHLETPVSANGGKSVNTPAH